MEELIYLLVLQGESMNTIVTLDASLPQGVKLILHLVFGGDHVNFGRKELVQG